MSPDQISIILDTVSFFFVTIDLYGEERLKSLHEKIDAVIGISVDILSDIQQSLAGKVSLVFAGCVMFLAIEKAANIIEPILSLFNLKFTVPGLINSIPDPVRELIMIAVNIVLTIAGTTLALCLGVFIVSCALKLATKMLQSIKLSGVLLTIGTILFLISKSIDWFYPT